MSKELSLDWVFLRFGYDWLLVEPIGQWRAGLGVRHFSWIESHYAFTLALWGIAPSSP